MEARATTARAGRLVALALVVAIAACSDDENSTAATDASTPATSIAGPATTATTATTATDASNVDSSLPEPSPGIATIEDALTTLPEGEAEETIIWGDVGRAAELAGLEAPSGTADVDAVVAYLSSLTGRPSTDAVARPVMVVTPTVSHVERAVQIDEFVDDVGWSILDVDRFVERATPPDTVTVLEGDFSEPSINAALGPAEAGVWVAGDPQDSPNPQDITPARPLGEAQWLTLEDGLLTVTTGLDATAEVAAAGAGRAPSLGDDEALTGVAEALDDAGAYAAMLIRPGPAVGLPAPAQPRCRQALSEPASAVGTGATADDESGLVLIALAHDSADAASANAGALEQLVAEGTDQATREPWRDRFTLDAVEVVGPVVLAKLRPVEDQHIDLWYRLLLERAGLVSSC
jgi:hypothetical protein